MSQVKIKTLNSESLNHRHGELCETDNLTTPVRVEDLNILSKKALLKSFVLPFCWCPMAELNGKKCPQGLNDWFQTVCAAVGLHLQDRIVVIHLCVTVKYSLPGGQEGPCASATHSHCLHITHWRLWREHWLTSFKLKLLVSLHHLRSHHALNLQGERRREVGEK